MKRLDTFLVELKLAPSRSKAQQMLEAREVEVLVRGAWTSDVRASQTVEDASHVRVRPAGETLKYVSRGGLKLESALKHLKMEVAGWICLDIGTSTGGFADCLLQMGAREVIGVDVGHDQLAESLRRHPRLKHREGVNARDLALMAEIVGEARIDLCVVDVSFISLDLILPTLKGVMPAGSRLLALVKPQFEVGPEGLGKGGLVRDPASYHEVQAKILRELKKYGFSTHEYFPSAVKGQDGNQEFFVHATRV